MQLTGRKRAKNVMLIWDVIQTKDLLAMVPLCVLVWSCVDEMLVIVVMS